MARGLRFASFLLLLISAGCGSGDGALSPADAEADHRSGNVGQVGEMLVLAKADHAKPPSKLADLAKYQMGFPNGYERLKTGDVVLIWDVPIQEGASDKVLAYEKDAAESGGYVLMQDGTTVKKLSADEFKAAPKAAK